MKKFFLLLLSAVICFSSCYDDSELKGSVEDLENRVSSLEEQCKKLNTNLTAMQSVVDAINEKDFVTGVSEVKEDGQVVGYTIKFTRSKDITIYHGEKGSTPQISVKKDSDGNYYWTLDGEWILADGNKVKANAENGENGITPELKIENGDWYMKVGAGAWQNLGSAVGEKGDSFFQNVEITETEVIITLADGQEFVIPVKARMSIQLSNVPETIAGGETVTVAYRIEGAAGKVTVKAIGQNGWTAKAVQKTYATGEITITAPDPVTNDEIILIAADENGETVMSSLSWAKEEVVIASIESVELPFTAGQFELTVETNTDYKLAFTNMEGGWLKVVATKAMRSEVLTIAYEANRQSAARSAEIVLQNAAGEAQVIIPVKQTFDDSMALEFIHTAANITGAAREYVLPVRVISMDEWNVSSNAAWAEARIEGDQVIVSAAANNEGDRVAEILVEGKAGDKEFSDVMTLNQIQSIAPDADLLDVEFDANGIARDLSEAATPVYTFLGDELTIEQSSVLGINAAIFNHGYNKAPSITAGSYTIPEATLRPTMEDGYTLEAYMMCSIEPIGAGKESKVLSSTQGGGTALMLHGTKKDITFLLCGAKEPEDKKVWRFIETGIIPVPGQWYHVIGTWDKATGTARVFVDGEMITEVVDLDAAGGVPADMKMHWSALGANAYFTIGANSSKGSAAEPVFNNSWQGGVAAPRIYSMALEPEQIPAACINIYKNKIQFID